MSDDNDTVGLDFPRESHVSSTDVFSWAEVKTILDKEIMRRVEYVTCIVKAMRARFGDEALDVAAQAIYEIGYRKGKARAKAIHEQGRANDLSALEELIAHKMARLYLGTTTEIGVGELVVRETYCPLPVYWKSSGMSDDETLVFCKIFDQVDKGMVKGFNPAYTADLGGAEGLAKLGYCQMVIRQEQAQGSQAEKE